jgi:mono/diheme cytochrome c family protein
VTALLLLIANIPRRWARQTFVTLGLVLSVTTAGWIAVTAHIGGVAVYEHGLGTVALRNSPPTPDGALANSPTRERGVAAPEIPAVSTPKSVSYARDIKPLLATRCSECHAGSELRGGFDISTVASITKGGKKSGAALLAGKPDDSPLVQYIQGKKRPQMPKGGKKLADSEIALIRQWIADGAVDDASGAVVKAPTAPAPATQVTISPDWDPEVQFSADENVAVRRFVRLKNLKPPPQPPKVEGVVYNAIDRFVVAKWKPEWTAKTPATTQTSTQPATQPADTMVCDDAALVRRVYLDLVGMIPTAGEAKAFIEDKDEKKREKLIDALLARTKDYAGNWVPFWEEALCSNGLHQGGVGTHGNYRQWIFKSFEENKPYDTMVQELLDPTMPAHPQRYVLNDNHMRTIQSSADTAQVFLGTAIKCASCHSHFLNDEWPQARAVAFAGFFAEKDMELIRCERKSGQFISTHFMFDLPAAPATAPADQSQRLHQVAQLITDPTNPRFARTIVNRLWKRYMGLGLFEPADDYREDTPPSHPELLDWLADDFVRHGYDVKRTTRLILTSRTYQLKYDPAVEDHFDVAKPKEPRYFRSPALRRLTEEQLLDSIAVTMGQRVPESRAFQSDVSSPLTRALGKPPVRNEVSTQRPDDTAVVQALELLNGPEWHDRVYKGELVTNSSVQPKVDELIDGVYWSAMGRAPDSKEKEAASEFLKSAPPPATTQPVEVVWMDDEAPARSVPQGVWKFVGPPDAPAAFSGKVSHTLEDPLPPGTNQHLFTGLSLPVAPSDTLFAYVYIDPANPPKEIMLQFLAGKDWSRATWGSEEIAFGEHTAMGPLPKLGEWVRLEVPAEKIGIKKPTNVTGLAFTQFNGKVYFDKSGAAKGPPIHDPQAIGDMLWALFTSPEFQYIK